MKTRLLLTGMVTCLVAFLGHVRGEDSVLIEPPWKDAADGSFNRGEYIDLNIETKERVLFLHSELADTGVQIERLKGDSIIWRKHVQPLGVMHSGYRHRLRVRIWRDVIYIVSRGDAGIIYETRKLSDGNLITREIRDVDKPISNFLSKEELDLFNERAKKGEQAGADQPATKPADKPPVKDQPSTPTPKVGPR